MEDIKLIEEELLSKISGGEVSGARDFILIMLTNYKYMYSTKEEFAESVISKLSKEKPISEEDKAEILSIIDREWNRY